MIESWMTVRDVAKYLQLSMDMIYKMAQQGKLPASKIGAQWRFKREEIDEWVRAQRPGRNMEGEMRKSGSKRYR